MWDTIRWALVFAVMYGVSMTVVYIGSKRRRKQNDAEDKRRTEERLARDLQKKRDHQLNHGRMIYNWLMKEFEQYKELGIQLWKIEDNGGQFSIQIVRRHDEDIYGVEHLIQISFDFVGYQAPYLGHIHYGKYGADILFWVGDHSPKNGLDRLVIAPIEAEVETLRKRLSRAS